MANTPDDFDAGKAQALASLRAAANDWSQAEFNYLRKQGLDRWATQEPTCFIHWELPLEGDPAGVQAHLTLQLSDVEVQPTIGWSLVWQLELVETGRWGRVLDQAKLAQLDMQTGDVDVEDGVDAILSVEPAQVLDWARQMLYLRGYALAHRLRH